MWNVPTSKASSVRAGIELSHRVLRWKEKRQRRQSPCHLIIESPAVNDRLTPRRQVSNRWLWILNHYCSWTRLHHHRFGSEEVDDEFARYNKRFSLRSTNDPRKLLHGGVFLWLLIALAGLNPSNVHNFPNRIDLSHFWYVVGQLIAVKLISVSMCWPGDRKCFKIPAGVVDVNITTRGANSSIDMIGEELRKDAVSITALCVSTTILL